MVYSAAKESLKPIDEEELATAILKFQNQFTKKDFYQLKKWTIQSIKKARHIITVSQFSKDEIIKTYHLNPDKITIAYNGVDTPPKINPATQQKILSSYLLNANSYFCA